MKTTLLLRIDKELKKKLKEKADKEKRSVTNLIMLYIETGLKTHSELSNAEK